VYRISRNLNAIHQAQQIVRDELLFAFLSPAQRAALTFDAYARSGHFSPGGEFFTLGLFAWEVTLLDHPRVPRAGRVLLAAAGGGRELRALIERGYQVYGFEPVEALVRSAQEIARGSDATVVRASYEDLLARAQGRSGALDDMHGPIDLCHLGWGSFSHLTELDEALGVLTALRGLAPRAPVILSFRMREPTAAQRFGKEQKFRHGLRRLLTMVGGHQVGPGLEFYAATGFTHAFSQDEINALFDQAGYELEYFSELGDYPHALLLPRTVDGEGATTSR